MMKPHVSISSLLFVMLAHTMAQAQVRSECVALLHEAAYSFAPDRRLKAIKAFESKACPADIEKAFPPHGIPKPNDSSAMALMALTYAAIQITPSPSSSAGATAGNGQIIIRQLGGGANATVIKPF
jgi:hypothetical protein